MTGMILIGIIWQPIYFYRTAQPFIPVLRLLVGFMLISNRRWFSWILPAFGIIVLVDAIGNWELKESGRYVNNAAAFINKYWQEGDILYYGIGTVAMPFNYYLDGKPAYIMDAKPDLNLTWPGIPFKSARLEDLEFSRAWLIYPLEPQIDPNDMSRLISYSNEGVLIWRIVTIHFAPIVVWLGGFLKNGPRLLISSIEGLRL